MKSTFWSSGWPDEFNSTVLFIWQTNRRHKHHVLIIPLRLEFILVRDHWTILETGQRWKWAILRENDRPNWLKGNGSPVFRPETGHFGRGTTHFTLRLSIFRKTVHFPPECRKPGADSRWSEETFLITWLYLLKVYSINYSSRKTGLPSSFLSTGHVFATRSTQSPSSLCFKWSGLLRAPNSTNSASSPSFENSPQS